MTVASATATPNGIFINPGLSRVMFGRLRNPKVTNPWTSTTKFLAVSLIRPLRITSITAIIPATKMLPKMISTSSAGPRIAPTAPISFQSPAPSARSSTNGKNTASPSPAPSSDAFPPCQLTLCQPQRTKFMITPAKNPDTVSQFGIFRVRQSVQPASSVSASATIHITWYEFIEIIEFYNSWNCPFFSRAQPLRDLIGEAAQKRIENYVSCPPTLVNIALMSLASVLIPAVAASATSTTSSPYSTRSCPASSCHNLFRRFLMSFPLVSVAMDRTALLAFLEIGGRVRLQSQGWAREKPSRLPFQDYVSLPPALVNIALMSLASVLIPAVAASATRTTNSPYSTRSWPSSSCHSLFRRFFMCFLSNWYRLRQTMPFRRCLGICICRAIRLTRRCPCKPSRICLLECCCGAAYCFCWWRGKTVTLC